MNNDDARWEAVIRRTPAADGLFYYGVQSTGIYCRPTCPSRRPKREHVAFFVTPEAAEQAGFRPCLRCHPKEVSTQQRVVAQARDLLEALDPAPTLAQLGAAVGMSPYHLQRLFRKATGMSPREYAAALRTERLKAGLRQGATVTGALYDAGYGSARALYDQAHRQLGMSPGAYKKGGQGVTIQYTLQDTPLGRMLLAATARGICALRFGEDEPLLAELHQEFPRATMVADAGDLDGYVSAVSAYLRGEHRRLDLPLDVNATAFQQKVWDALCAIPYGETRSYQAVAQSIGDPRAVRAVARACATNPVALVVPCHRVVRAGGELSGYRWGVERKRRLLDREKSQ
jgi:AraC family transcriptional regulator, regulatory protein of adaptative response / methylated-DNA-[protein]-cysteine methyltransferase